MPDPVPPETFAAMLAQAGLKPDAAEAEDWRQAHAKVLAILELCRPNALAAEPAFTFAVEEVA